MTDPITQARDWPATAERLQLLAAACAVTGLDHLPIVSRENAAPFAADLLYALRRIDTLKEALKPFAKIPPFYPEDWPDDDYATIPDEHYPTVGDFRRAARVLAPEEGR